MRLPTLAAVLLMGEFTFLFLASCGDDRPPLPGETPTRAPSATVVPSPTVSPIRTAVDTLHSENIDAILARVVMSAVPCATENWPQPPCAPGEPDGTPRQLFPFVSCEPAYLGKEELRFVLGQITAGRAPRLYAAVETTASGGMAAFPTGPYVLVFETTPPVGAAATGFLAVLDEAGSIRSIRTGCRATPEQLLASVDALRPIEGVGDS